MTNTVQTGEKIKEVLLRLRGRSLKGACSAIKPVSFLTEKNYGMWKTKDCSRKLGNLPLLLTRALT